MIGCLVVGCVFAAGLFAAEPDGAVLYGDGAHDDTAAIQSRLDSGVSCVYLPPPKVRYLISKPLRIHSDQELRLDRFTVVRLAPKSDCAMVKNDGIESGNVRVALTGGIWDMDNLNQSPNPIQIGGLYADGRKRTDNDAFDDGRFAGVGMRFRRVRGLTIRGVTVRNPSNFSVQLMSVTDFTVDDVTFDFTTWNPIPLNMDGIHVDGGCHRGRITNLKGTTFDDLVALNADECRNTGPISDIEIDGIFADSCHSAVRMLSTGSSVERVTIRNVFSDFYVYAVCCSHYFADMPRGTFRDIVVENVFTGKCYAPEKLGRDSRVGYPLFWVENDVDVDSLTLRNIVRVERNITVPTIRVDPRAKVRKLVVRDCRQENRTGRPLKFLDVLGEVGTLIDENNDQL